MNRVSAKGRREACPGFDLYQALSECRTCWKAYRWSSQRGRPDDSGMPAAGVFGAFSTDRRDDGVRSMAQSDPLLHVDAEVKLREVTRMLIREFGIDCIPLGPAIQNRRSLSGVSTMLEARWSAKDI